MSHCCCCWLDLLPVELLHHLFTYFSADEILLGFFDVSDYINAILKAYSVYQIDLRSIRKSDFDAIHRHISPKQIISLTLSDADTTVVPSKLFLSYFPVEQLTGLRSLTLIDIGIRSFQVIFSNLHILTELCSLSFNEDSMRHNFPAWNGNSSNESQRFKSFLSKIYSQVLPTLNCIHLNHSIDLVSIPLPYLRRLKLTKCSLNDLNIIFQQSPQLRSLDICLHINISNIAFILPTNQLTRLHLKIEDYSISKDQIELILSNLFHLKHLEIRANVWENVCDGDFWQRLTYAFQIFDFKFKVSQINVQKVLHSFRTSFWLEEKRWHVAFQNGCLFSIPRFVPIHIDTFYSSQFYSTASNPSTIYNYLSKLTINSYPSDIFRYTRVKTVVFEYSIPFKTLALLIDLNQIEHLIIPSLYVLLTLESLKRRMPQWYKLTVRNTVTIDMIKRIRPQRFEQIRILQIRLSDECNDYIMEELFLLFPFVEQLIEKSYIQTLNRMVHFMVGFQYLTSASFSADCAFSRKEAKFCRNPHAAKDYLPRSTCQIYYSTNAQLPLSIHWSIEKQSTNHLSMIRWPWRRGYRWYRMKYSLLNFFDHNFTWIENVLQFFMYFIIVVLIHKFYRNLDMYFCLIKTIFITVIFHSVYRLFHSVKNDNTNMILTSKMYMWFIFGFIVFFFSFISQIAYDYII